LQKHALSSFQPGKSTSPDAKVVGHFISAAANTSALSNKNTQSHRCHLELLMGNGTLAGLRCEQISFVIRDTFTSVTQISARAKSRITEDRANKRESYYHLKSKFVIYGAAPPSDKHLSFGADKFE
jgi:hypothetical protein